MEPIESSQNKNFSNSNSSDIMYSEPTGSNDVPDRPDSNQNNNQQPPSMTPDPTNVGDPNKQYMPPTGSGPADPVTPPTGSGPDDPVTPPSGSGPDDPVTPPTGSGPADPVTPPTGSGPADPVTPPTGSGPDVPGAGKYAQYWRVVILSIATSRSSSSIRRSEIAEVEWDLDGTWHGDSLFGGSGDEPASGLAAICSSFSSYFCRSAFDGSSTTFFRTDSVYSRSAPNDIESGNTPGWVGVHFARPVSPSGIRVYTSDERGCPDQFLVQYSNDGESWNSLLETTEGQSNCGGWFEINW